MSNIEEIEDRNEAKKLANNIYDSSWSGETIAQLMIYKQLKRIADVLEKKEKKEKEQ